MTDLFVGGEDTSVAVTGSAPFATTNSGSFYRAAFARGAIIPVSTGNTLDPPTNRATLVPAFGAQASLWFHAMYGNASAPGTTLNAVLFRLLDGATARLMVRSTATSGQVKISKRNAAGTFTDLVTSAAGAFPGKATPTAVDLFVDYQVAGQATLYIDGAIIATFSGDVTTDSATTLSGADLVGLSNAAISWSELLVRDGGSPTLGAAVQTLPPVASGNTQSWLPNTVGNINEAVLSDLTFVSTSSVNALQQWTVSTSLPAGNWTISSVCQNARISRGATGPQNAEWLVRTVDGTDHVTGAIAPVTSFGNFTNIWLVNPFTGVPWLAGDLINAGVESLT